MSRWSSLNNSSFIIRQKPEEKDVSHGRIDLIPNTTELLIAVAMTDVSSLPIKPTRLWNSPYVNIFWQIGGVDGRFPPRQEIFLSRVKAEEQ